MVEEIFEHGHFIKSGCFDTQNSYSASGVNSHRIISTKIEVRTLREYSIFLQKCEAILNNVLLLFWTHSLSFGIISKPRLTGTVVQNTRNSVIKNSWIINTFNIYKRLLKPPQSISAFWSLVGNTKWVLQCFGFVQIVRTLCHSRARFFKNYIPGSQTFFSFFHENFHLNLLRCQCRNTKQFSNIRPQQFPRQSSTNSYKTLEKSVTMMMNFWLQYLVFQLNNRAR